MSLMHRYFKFVIFGHGTIVQNFFFYGSISDFNFSAQRLCNKKRIYLATIWRKVMILFLEGFSEVSQHIILKCLRALVFEQRWITYLLGLKVSVSVSPWRWWVRGFACLSFVIPLQGQWNSLLSLIWKKKSVFLCAKTTVKSNVH